MKLKVCGMKQNPAQVAALSPDYLGFIFWEPSSRYFNVEIPKLPKSIKKVGVFVNAKIEDILEKVTHYKLDAVQLHGQENTSFCTKLQQALAKDELQIQIIKVFSIKDQFDFGVLEPFEELCDYFLFDTKGKLPGGNGYAFDWSVLKSYPSTKPYFLSGGIGLESSAQLKSFIASKDAKQCHAIDVNSQFEIEPGLKNIDDLKRLKKLLKNELSR